MRNSCVEIRAHIPGKGYVAIWRGQSYRRALSERCNRGLRVFQGSKTSIVERTTSMPVKPFGWLMSER